MARKKPPMQYVPLEERPEFIAAMTALPNDPAELEVRAERVLQLYHDAMLAADVQALDDAHLVHQACVVKLNGGMSRGCASVQDDLAAKFAAPAGQVPKWGQAGEFLLEVDGIRMVVKMDVGNLANHCGAELRAVDFDKPFISRTGYRHQYMRPAQHVGRTVDQAVRAEVLEGSAREGWATAIDQEHGKPKDRKVWPWLADALAGVRPDGQLAMFGEAPKDPDAKVPLTNAQRQKAFRERRNAEKEAAKEAGLVSLTLAREDLAYMWWAMSVFLTARRDLDHLKQPYVRERLAKIFGGQPWWTPEAVDKLDQDQGILNGEKQVESERKRGWDEYQKESKALAATCRDLNAVREENRQLQARLQVLEAQMGEASSPKMVVELNRLLDVVKELEGRTGRMGTEIYQLKRENALLESERNEAHKAIKLWENRLRAAGQSTDCRALPGEPGHVTVTPNKD